MHATSRALESQLADLIQNTSSRSVGEPPRSLTTLQNQFSTLRSALSTAIRTLEAQPSALARLAAEDAATATERR